MPRKSLSYTKHKATGQARVWIHGAYVYLGKYGSKASREKYARVVADSLQEIPIPSGGIRVAELVYQFWEANKGRYYKDGAPTSEHRSFATALRPVVDLFGAERATDFGPRMLEKCRLELIKAGYCRKRINGHIYRIRKAWKWAVSREIVPVAVWQGLCALEGLRHGEATEPDPVGPVPLEHVDATLPLLTRQLQAMATLQLLTAARPGEVCGIRSSDLLQVGAVWEYRPFSHKTQHHGKARVVFIGPKAQETLQPWLREDPDKYLFSPAEARLEWLDSRRKRPARDRCKNPLRAPGSVYTSSAYGHAIARACARASVPRWSPNQLRHNAATEIRRRFGVEAAQVILGHSSLTTSEVYAERDFALARRVVSELG